MEKPKVYKKFKKQIEKKDYDSDEDNKKKDKKIG